MDNMNKNKKLKIFSILVVMVLVALVAIGIVFADTQINKKTSTKNKCGGTYHNAFQGKGKKLYEITWEDVENCYYINGEIPKGYKSDYDAYIEKSNDGYCLNHNTGDTTDNGKFYVSAIVDIEGENVKIINDNKGKEFNHVGPIASNVAEAVYLRYKFPTGTSSNNEGKYNRSYCHYWFGRYGWKNLHEKIEKSLNDGLLQPDDSNQDKNFR